MTDQRERRKEPRQRVLKGGKVFYNNYAVSFDCMIRNQSENGMQIKTDPSISLPNHLAILNRKDGMLADAKVVWHKAGTIGIEFESEQTNVRSLGKADIRRMSIIATRG